MTLLDDLQNDGARLLRYYLNATDDQRTSTLRRLADICLDARDLTINADNQPDVTGKTYAYRKWVGDMYARAGIEHLMQTRIQKAVNYHISNQMRSRYSPETLAKLGLKSETGKERAAQRRRNHPAQLRREALLEAVAALRTHPHPIGDAEDAAAVIEGLIGAPS